MYVAGALEYERPFLGPLCKFRTFHPRDSIRAVPSTKCLILSETPFSSDYTKWWTLGDRWLACLHAASLSMFFGFHFSLISVFRGSPCPLSSGSVFLPDGVVPLFPLLCVVCWVLAYCFCYWRLLHFIASDVLRSSVLRGIWLGEEFKTSPQVAAHPS